MKRDTSLTRFFLRWQRFWRITPTYLKTVARREWQLAFLAIVGLAPGVAALVAWTNIALIVEDAAVSGESVAITDWLLPSFLLELLGAPGVLVGTGVVTLLIGCLSLTNIYLVSLDRRWGEIHLLMALGLNRLETFFLLLIEAFAAGLLGSGVGLISSFALSVLSWPSAERYFQLETSYQMRFEALIVGVGIGVFAALLFMGTATLMTVASLAHFGQARPSVSADPWLAVRSSLWGPIFAGLLTFVAALSLNSSRAAFILCGLGLVLAGLLTGGGWVLTHVYRQIPTPPYWPLWTMAIQGLARHLNYTTGMALSFIAGAYGTGMAVLTWWESDNNAIFPFWVAGVILTATASLVLTIASMAAWERRREFGMLTALGAKRGQLRRLVLLEYTTVAGSAGLLGSLIAVVSWLIAGGSGHWFVALSITFFNMLAVVISAWIGALPVLRILAARSPQRLMNREGY